MTKASLETIARDALADAVGGEKGELETSFLGGVFRHKSTWEQSAAEKCMERAAGLSSQMFPDTRPWYQRWSGTGTDFNAQARADWLADQNQRCVRAGTGQ